MNGDDSTRQRIKQELYSTTYISPQKRSKFDTQMDTDDIQGQAQQQQREDFMQLEEENKKTYRALLQNQVLGIDNVHLLHEIHNSEDYIY